MKQLIPNVLCHIPPQRVEYHHALYHSIPPAEGWPGHWPIGRDEVIEGASASDKDGFFLNLSSFIWAYVLLLMSGPCGHSSLMEGYWK